MRATDIDYQAPLSRRNGLPVVAGLREAGAGCPFCSADIAPGDGVIVCQACGTVHHQGCWQEHETCGSYECAPARRDPRGDSEPKLVISAEELAGAVPLPSRRAANVFVPSSGSASPAARPDRPGRWSRLAIAAFVCGLAGIPLFGVITGLVAILLGSLALGTLRASAQRGLGLALAGMLLGLVDVVGWLIFLTSTLGQHPAADVQFDDLPTEQVNASDFTPKIRRAMQANVLIERRGGWKALGAIAIGSGVILDVADGEALIATNRHVVDLGFPGDSSDPDLAKLNNGEMSIKLLGQPPRAGRVVWVAPGGVDLALVRVASSNAEAMAAKWQPKRPVHVGDPVFAIGNPHRLGWTHTQGVVSQFRTRAVGDRRLRLIQTEAAINPGNSGGGLYDQDGYLIGIMTLSGDKRVSEGLSFAIAVDSLLDLAPPGVSAREESPGTGGDP